MAPRATHPFAGQLVALLRSEAAEKQLAAAVVVGELALRDPAIVQALLALVDSGLAPLQRHGLEALTRIDARAALPRALALVAARDEGVRTAALIAVVACGAAAVAAVRARIGDADGEERRALEEALARLGGRDAFGAMLANLDTTNVEAARAATLTVRQQIKQASARERKGHLGQVLKFLDAKSTQGSPVATAAALKLLGFLAEEGAIKRLLGFATDKKQPEAVREEAVIALRFAAQGTAAAKLAAPLLGVAESAPPSVARAALYTLAGVPLDAPLVKRLGQLATHVDGQRALVAIERLAQLPAPAAADALSKVLLATTERVRAEAAGAGLAARADAGPALARALVAAPDADRAGMLARMLRPHVGKLDARVLRPVREQALERMRDGKPGWEPALQVAREGDARGTAAALRALAGELRKARKLDRALVVLRVLGGSAEALPDDGYALAALELAAGRRDQAILIFGQLVDRGFDVAAALRRDRSLDAEQRYQIGFHFAERRHPLGEEVLTALVESAGRSKLGQMARAKLKSAGFSE